MSKQKLEQYFRNSISGRQGIWFTKLFNNHFTPTPADFIVLTENNKYLIECKQTRYNERFAFDRFTQADDMLKFELISPNNHGFILLMFWNDRLIKSEVFMIPLKGYLSVKNILLSLGDKSMKIETIKRYFDSYKVKIIDGKLDLNEWLK